VKADGSDGSYVFWKQGKPVFLFWLDYSAPLEKFLAMLRKVAEKYKGDAFFLYEDGTKVAKHMQWFGYSGEKFPAMIAFDTKAKVEYTYDENNALTEDSIESFIADLKAHKLKKFTRKQPVPKTPDTGVTKTLVYDTFRTEVMDSTKDVAVFYYIPTCGFCMDFLAEFEKLANQLSGVTTLAFGKIDLSKNDSPPPIIIRNFPTVIMFPSEDKHNYKIYSGKRTIPDLLKFYQESVHTPFEAPVLIAAEPHTDEVDEGDEGDDGTHEALNSLKDQIHH
jgi:protein disulfide-isomerase A1